MRQREHPRRARRPAVLLARLWARLWFMPILGAAVAVGISVVTVTLDKRLTDAGVSLPVVAAAPSQIATLYSVIAASILNLLALVFTILIVVLQLTSSQYSHRALRTLLRDTQSRVTLGVFVTTFMHALIVLTWLGTTQATEERVAGVSVSSTLVLSVVSIVTFLLFIDHIVQAIRVTAIIGSIGEETRWLIDRLYEDEHGAPAAEEIPSVSEHPLVVAAPDAGVVASVDVGRLVEAGSRCGRVFELVPAIGDFVPRGAPLLRVHDDPRRNSSSDGEPPERLARFVSLEAERTMDDDVAFGLRQLVDVAERALSTGMNDPTIAVHALDQVHDLLRALCTRTLPGGDHADAQGCVRLVVSRPTWENYLSLACDEVRHYGASSLQVMRRMRAMLEDLLAVAPAERREPVRRQLLLLERSVRRNFPDEEERSIASEADAQGHGSPRHSANGQGLRRRDSRIGHEGVGKAPALRQPLGRKH